MPTTNTPVFNNGLADAYERLRESLERLSKAVAPYSHQYKKAGAKHPRWLYLANHHKKHRVRRKWENALWKEVLNKTDMYKEEQTNA